MRLKPRHKRRIYWTLLAFVAVLVLAIIVVPPFITLNTLKPRLESAILTQTGVEAKIRGDVNFSILGRATIVAHDISIPNGAIKNAMFSAHLGDIFDLENARLGQNITISGGELTIDTIGPQPFNYDIGISNFTINFLNKNYDIVRGIISNGRFNGTIRTDQHKYDVEFSDDEFFITNNTNNLELSGMLFADGGARGQISILTRDANRWFQFSRPQIKGPVDFSANFEWDGGYGVKFHDIVANNFVGNIDLLPDGRKNIQLASRDLEYDFSFLLSPANLDNQIHLDLDFYGKLKMGRYMLHHLKINAVGMTNSTIINTVVADDTIIRGGYIDANGAHEIGITTIYNNIPASCVLSGNKHEWVCYDFSYGDIHGTISVKDDIFNINVRSNGTMPEFDTIHKLWSYLGKKGRIDFIFADVAGTFEIDGDNIHPTYSYARNKTLGDLNIDIKFIPKFMYQDIGNAVWNDDTMEFTPHNGQWSIAVNASEFKIWGKSLKLWLPDVDLEFLNDTEYEFSGNYTDRALSNVILKTSGHVFAGSATPNQLTIRTEHLNLDAMINKNYTDNYQELSFLSQHPLIIPFDIPTNVSLMADRLTYDGNEYENFLYSLKGARQTFSITDHARGNLLATIDKGRTKYNIDIQLNKFNIRGTLLSSTMPINVRDTSITAEIKLQTYGQIAQDIEYNTTGTMDITFDDGYIIGLGIDNFYAAAQNITRMNAEYALSDALSGGNTYMKKMHIIGKYASGNFETTTPLELSMRHTDAMGIISIENKQMSATFDMILRGTSPTPQPIEFQILPDGGRRFSLSQIMTDFDPSFLRAFVKTHNRF